jgi:hypothetical protein
VTQDEIEDQMSVEIGGWLSLLGIFGLALCATGWNKSERGSTLENLSAVGVLVCAVAALAMVFQGFHLWNTGWEIDLRQMDTDVAGRTAARARGRGGIILLVIQFFPQFLVFGYGAVLWQASSIIRESAKTMGLVKTQSDS